MREIKFRGKDERGCWHVGWLAETNDGTIYIAENDEGWTDDGFHNDDFSGWHKVLEKTIGQFTGLLDKNGKEIFEGDIVRDSEGRNSYVKWLIQRCGFVLVYERFDEGITGSYGKIEHLEVVGNIHDNKESMKGE